MTGLMHVSIHDLASRLPMPMIHTIFVVPVDIEHVLVWTRLPIINFPQVPTQITSRLYQDGLWGFTGCSSPPPSPSTLPLCLPALADWNVTIDKLIRFPKATLEEDEMIKEAGREIDQFVRNKWIESEFETAWFVNPPVGPPCACPDPPILSLLVIYSEASKYSGAIPHSCLRSKEICGGDRTWRILSWAGVFSASF